MSSLLLHPSVVFQILTEINNGDIYISPSNIYSVIVSLANKGHYQHIPEVGVSSFHVKQHVTFSA